jgi:uncharacterized protein YcfL
MEIIMKRIVKTALLGSVLLLAACSTSSKLINYRGGDLKGVIEVEKSAVVLTEGGLPQAKAILVNKSGVTQKFEYKFTWLDANDMTVDEDNRPWRPVTLKGKDEVNIGGTGPNDSARKFQIQVRAPQGVTQ